MGMFEGAARNDAAARAIALGRRQMLPISARSLSAAQVARRAQGLVPVLAVLLALPAAGLLALAAFGDGWAVLAYGLPPVLLAGFILHRIGRARRQRHRGYIDPGILVTVGESGLRVEGPDGGHEIAFAEARFDLALDWQYRSFRASIADFVGIRLNSPLGRLAIEDSAFQEGRRAAAAICARCAAIGRRHGG